MNHEAHMALAIAVAKKAAKAPFGTVIVCQSGGRVVCEGVNRSEENRILHGEIDACLKLTDLHVEDVSDLILYTTAEPCPMCQSAILWTGIQKVVFGTSIPTLIELGWNQIDIPSQSIVESCSFADCEITGGILKEECDALFRR